MLSSEFLKDLFLLIAILFGVLVILNIPLWIWFLIALGFLGAHLNSPN